MEPSSKDYKLCLETFQKLKKNANAQPFLHPVDYVTLNIPDYPEIIKHPMDLSTVKKKLETKEYESPEDFKNDIILIIDNCLLYNPEGNYVNKMAKDFQKYFNSIWHVKKEKKEDSPLMKIHQELEKVKYKKYNWPFLEPVDIKLIPNYKKIIKNPTDLQTIKKKIENNEYSDISEYRNDLNLMIKNCFKFNSVDSEVYKCGEEMEKLVKKIFNEEESDEVQRLKTKIKDLEKRLEKYEKKKFKKYNSENRVKLAAEVQKLDENNAREIILILKDYNPNLELTDKEEIEVDFGTLPDHVLEEIEDKIKVESESEEV
ncbi:Transcription factor [Spraguea lophii 42_110]|uniref:Transcription factor n=1 Tax=Spraguea lophii (strain 42_110) TaxID=1358809 RepID=S7WB02_SPRLO|nr:Transcription factor [Spraguea lophii 42_110]